jgi:hypothetical protein
MWDIFLRYAPLMAPRRREELQCAYKAHLLSVVKKMNAVPEYKDVLNFLNVLSSLQCSTHSLVHD